MSVALNKDPEEYMQFYEDPDDSEAEDKQELSLDEMEELVRQVVESYRKM